MSKLNELSVRKEVAHELAIGKTQTDIAKQVDVDRSQISRFASKDKNKKLIEEAKENLIEVVPGAVRNVKDLVEEMPTLAKDDIDNRKLAYKASQDTLKATGLFPTQSNNYIKNQVNIQDNSTTISPAFQEYMDLKSKYREIYDPEKDTESDDN